MNELTCPLCGAPANWREILKSNWQRREYHAYGWTLSQYLSAGAEYERRRPARDATFESDVAVPGIQALVSGLIAGLGGGGLAAALGSPRFLLIGLGIGAGAMGLAWFTLLREQRRLLWEVETITGVDWDQDGQVGPPEPPTVRVEIVEACGRVITVRVEPPSSPQARQVVVIRDPLLPFPMVYLPDAFLRTYADFVETLMRFLSAGGPAWQLAEQAWRLADRLVEQVADRLSAAELEYFSLRLRAALAGDVS